MFSRFSHYPTLLKIEKKLKNARQTVGENLLCRKKSIKTGNYFNVKEKLMTWFTPAKRNNIKKEQAITSVLLLQEKALQIAKVLGMKDFTASAGWRDRLKEKKKKKRHNVLNKVMHGGKGNEVDSESVLKWKSETLT